MTTLTFTAHCQRGHDRVDFTDRAEFEAHMIGKHKALRRLTGGAGSYAPPAAYFGVPRPLPAAPGWHGGKFSHYPEHATRTAGGLEKVAERIAAGEYRWPGQTYVFPNRLVRAMGEIAGEVA